MISRIIEFFGKAMPNCFAALRLAERGAEKPLSLPEKAALRYHSGLCLHCNCAQRKFDRAVEILHEAEAQRKK